MVGKRFAYDGKSCIILSDEQIKYKKKFEDKIKSGEYEFEKVNCQICNSSIFHELSEKDRYGLKMSVVICKECGLIQTNPRMNETSYSEFYKNEYRKIYENDKDAIQREFVKEVSRGRDIFEYIKKNTDVKLNDKFVVEIGTGAGGILQKFQNEGNRVLGVDYGHEYIEYGKKKNLNLKVGSIEILEQEKEKPDIVILSHVVEHFLEPIQILTRIRNLLNKESLVYIEVPGIKNLENSYEQDFLKYLQNAHVYHFTLDTLKNCCCKAGLLCLKGNEIINSIFKTGEDNNNLENSFDDTINYLKRIERMRVNPLNKFRVKKKFLPRIIDFLEKTNTKEIARKAYKKSKN